MKKSLSLTLALAMLVAMLSSCSSDTSSSGDSTSSTASVTSSAGTEDAPTSGSSASTASLITTDEPEGLVAGTSVEMILNSDVTACQRPGQQPSAKQLYFLIYDTLFWSTTGDLADMDGLLVESYSISDDYCEWTLNLHEDVFFANGRPLTAEAVYSCFEYLYVVGGNTTLAGYDFEVTGDYQLTVTMDAPAPEFMVVFASPELGICDCTELWETGDTVESCYMIGSGPYYVSDYGLGDYITFTAVEDHWNADRQAHIETINAKIVTNSTTISTAIQAGETDHAVIYGYSDYEILYDLDGYNLLEVIGNTTITMINDSGYGCEYLTNSRVREALIMLIDVDEAFLTATYGYGVLQPNAFSTLVDYTQDRTYDPEGALAILEEEGVDPNDIVLTGIASSDALFSNLQSQWSEYGITLEFTAMDSAAVRTAGMYGEWDLWTDGGGLSDISFSSGLKNLFANGGAVQMIHDTDAQAYAEELMFSATSQDTMQDMYSVLADLAAYLDEYNNYIFSSASYSWPVFSDKIQNATFCGVVGHWRAWESWVA